MKTLINWLPYHFDKITKYIHSVIDGSCVIAQAENKSLGILHSKKASADILQA